MEPFENDAADPCIGGAPGHPFGLRLSFQRDGETVRSRLLARQDLHDAPERLHSALLHLALTGRPAAPRVAEAEVRDAQGPLVARLEREYVLPGRGGTHATHGRSGAARGL